MNSKAGAKNFLSLYTLLYKKSWRLYKKIRLVHLVKVKDLSLNNRSLVILKIKLQTYVMFRARFYKYG